MTDTNKANGLRERLRIETKPMHDLLESSYPFSVLGTTHDEDTSKKALRCFYLMFKDFLYFSKDEDAFYVDALNHLENSVSKEERIIENFSGDVLAMKYLFLGSRMGNEVIVKKNPTIENIPGGKYFGMGFPRSLWVEFVSKLDEITDEAQQNEIVENSKIYFKKLATIGNSLRVMELAHE